MTEFRSFTEDFGLKLLTGIRTVMYRRVKDQFILLHSFIYYVDLYSASSRLLGLLRSAPNSHLVLSTLWAIASVFTSLIHWFHSVVTSLYSSASFIPVTSISSIHFLLGRRGGPRIFRWEGMMKFWPFGILRWLDVLRIWNATIWRQYTVARKTVWGLGFRGFALNYLVLSIFLRFRLFNSKTFIWRGFVPLNLPKYAHVLCTLHINYIYLC